MHEGISPMANAYSRCSLTWQGIHEIRQFEANVPLHHISGASNTLHQTCQSPLVQTFPNTKLVLAASISTSSSWSAEVPYANMWIATVHFCSGESPGRLVACVLWVKYGSHALSAFTNLKNKGLCVQWIFREVTVQEVLMGYFTNPMYVPSSTTSAERLLNISFLEPGDQPINDPVKYFLLHDEDFPSVDAIDWVTIVQAIIPVNGRRYHWLIWHVVSLRSYMIFEI